MSKAGEPVPPRAPLRWFCCIDYAGGLKIELPCADEAAAVEAALSHLRAEAPGAVKIGHYGFRSRVIVCGPEELRRMAAEYPP